MYDVESISLMVDDSGAMVAPSDTGVSCSPMMQRDKN